MGAEPPARGAGSVGNARSDLDYMRAALALARRGLGNVWPNPAVGCVLVGSGRIVGRGWTRPGGRPHAETEALRRAGARARGATAYVSLEPCSHQGQTPPCAEALIAAGVRRVVAAIEDPDRRVSGSGIARLRAAGIAVDLGVGAEPAAEINAGFLSRVRRGRPLVTLKLAASLDGRIATASGESRWITGPPARDRAHLLRARNDAVMVGIGTVLADDPQLTCRLPGLDSPSPVRVIVDSDLRLPPTARLIAEAGPAPLWVVTARPVDPGRGAALRTRGATLIEIDAAADGVDLAAALAALGRRGITRLLVEGGAGLAAGLLKAGLVDRLAWFHAPMLIGGDAVPAIAALGIDGLAQAPAFERVSSEPVGADLLTMFRTRDS
jgi:diaminohydroxyphosphoribosylaminopyrimidine deaminase / 5-amino-6-(5-phosphoribosylamino)uracil reductase